jgi:hypothetical protein
VSASPRPRRWPNAFGLHLACVVWILFVLSVSLGRHQSLADLRRTAATGSTQERIEALVSLGQRAAPAQFQQRAPAALLNESDSLLREFAFTNTFSRNPAQRLDDDALAQIADPDERFRASLWLYCRMTTPRRVTLADLDRWFQVSGP